MNIIETSELILPSNPEDLKRIKEAIQEISNSMTRQDAEKDHIKGILDGIKEKYAIKPKHLRKVARAYHKQNFGKDEQEYEAFETLYRQVIGDAS